MIDAKLLRNEGVLVLAPRDTLETTDFDRLRLLTEQYIGDHGRLNGVLIDAESFTGWADFSSMLSHIRFIEDYHEKIERVAAVGDSGFLKILPSVADYFVAAEIRHFTYDDRNRALSWLETGI
jgi:hypothetical protein